MYMPGGRFSPRTYNFYCMMISSIYADSNFEAWLHLVNLCGGFGCDA